MRASLKAFLLFSAGSFFLVAAHFRHVLTSFGLPAGRASLFAGAASLMAFPFWFMLERGNIEIVVFSRLGCRGVAFVRQRGYTAAACFALAASFKIVPVLYFALFLKRRQYGLLAFACMCAAGFVLISLWFAGPSISLASHGIAGGVTLFTREFLVDPKPDSIGFDHSLFSIYRRFFNDARFAPQIYRLYTPCVALIGAALYLLRIRFLPFVNQLLCLSIAAIWLPPVSFEYTLLHLYVGMAILSLAVVAHEKVDRSALDLHGITACMVLLAVLGSPISELILYGSRYAGQVQSILLLLLFVLALTRPLLTLFDHAQDGVLPQPHLKA